MEFLASTIPCYSPRMSSPRALLVPFVCACVLAAGCAGNGPPPPSTTSSFDTIQATIFNVRCVNAGCHGTNSPANLVLLPGASYGNLINVAPTNDAARARGLLRVVPGDPDHSFLLIKLTGPPSDEGSAMPLTPPALSANQISLIREWILAGAPGPSLPPVMLTATATRTPVATRSPTATPTRTLPPSATPTPTQPPTAAATATTSPPG